MAILVLSHLCSVCMPLRLAQVLQPLLAYHCACIVLMLSVRLSVTLRYRDHIGWNSAKIISRLIRLTYSLSADPNMTDLLQREHPQNFSRNRSGVGEMSIFDI